MALIAKPICRLAILNFLNHRTDEKNVNDTATVAKNILRLNILPQRRCSRIHRRFCGGLFMVRRLAVRVIGVFILMTMVVQCWAQTETARVSGQITDAAGRSVPKAEVRIVNLATGVASRTTTNDEGIYSVTGLIPGRYRVTVQKQGFREVIVDGLTLNVQDVVAQNVQLQIGSVSETVTVEAGGTNINTTDAAVGTVVDRQFVGNMPLNGRSFQTLLTLVPGVLQVPSSGVGYSGEISVNGQRTEANYFTVDGVAANTGSPPNPNIVGAGFAGGVPGETALGTTQSLVSIDALQEFRATTSTYSAEYGRTPGGQFSLSTRSGTNDWHGSLFNYFRNDVMDANNSFNNAANPQVPRQAERQNDFGVTLGGPMEIPGFYNGKDKTFFFFSYEGLRLRVPQPSQQFSVPDLALRQQAPSALQPFLNAFPIPNAGEDGLNDGLAFFNLAYSAPSSLDNYAIRIDHRFGDNLTVFGRYADTPSSGWTYHAPANKLTSAIKVQTLTLGATTSITHTQTNELRFNITQNNTTFNLTSTDFGGATPFDFSVLPEPPGQPAKNLTMVLAFGGFPTWQALASSNSQRQYNLTDTHSWSHAAHQLRFGVDWRRLRTLVKPVTNDQFYEFSSQASLTANSADLAEVLSFTSIPVQPVYHNFSSFFQDEWKITSRLSLSLGLRWDINPAPSNLTGPSPYTLTQITNLATAQLAPTNTPLWKTDWHGFAPRAGLAYQLQQVPGRETVVRAGFGIFYDMGSTNGSQGFAQSVGFTSSSLYFGVPAPLTAEQVTLPAPSIASPYNAPVFAFDPNLRLPYTMQWNLAVEQALGSNQALTITYVGSGGRKLLTQFFYSPVDNPNFSLGNGLSITANRASSNYNSLQLKYQRNLSRGLQALASYTLSHSIDDASSNFGLNDRLLRSSSDFDIRHNFQAAITYEVPGTYANSLASAVLAHWGLDTRISARSALPVDIIGAQSFNPVDQQFVFFHPDLVPGQPIYLYSSQYPGGRTINFNAFVDAPDGVEGNTSRNFARGFGAVQMDFAVRREFPIWERLRLQFRAEAFNIFNHPNFGSIYQYLSYGPGQFGYAYSTLNNTLGGLNPLYQSGGPRSLQLALKAIF
jgi:hypothetical protein